MARWNPGARGRLIRSALELFQEQGFTETTVPQISARAGVTNRTFFRYFGDKREVVFGNEAEVAAELRKALADIPDDVGWAEFLALVVQQLAERRFAASREDMRTLRVVIASDDGLRERSLAKWDNTQAVLAEALNSRGLAPARARVLADSAVAALQLAIGEWLEADDDVRLVNLALSALDSLHADLGAVLDVAARSRT